MTLSSDPVPTTHYASGNIHRLAQLSPTLLVLQPGRSLWVQAILWLLASPIVLGIGLTYSAETKLALGLCLMPLFAAAAMTVAAICYYRFGTRVRLDRLSQRIAIIGFRHANGLAYSFADVRAVQFCERGTKGDKPVRFAYQVNLVIDGDHVTRINLLNSGGRSQLLSIAKGIAEFVNVPLYIGSIPAKS